MTQREMLQRSALRSEAAIWAEGTKYTTDELVREFDEYECREVAECREPVCFQTWAEEIMGIPNL